MIKCQFILIHEPLILRKIHGLTYRPGQTNLQISLCQKNSFGNLFTFKCGIFSKVKIQGFQYDQDCRCWPPRVAQIEFTKKIWVSQSENLGILTLSN